jgi:chitosanase
MHGPGTDAVSFGGIRRRARKRADTPTDGGNETTYLNAFLDARVWAMKQEPAHSDVTRVETAQRVFLRKGNLDLDPPLKWQVYGAVTRSADRREVRPRSCRRPVCGPGPGG